MPEPVCPQCEDPWCPGCCPACGARLETVELTQPPRAHMRVCSCGFESAPLEDE